MKWALYNLTSTTQSGGVETGVWRLARAFAEMGQDVVVIGGASQRPLPAAAQGLEVKTFAFRDRQRFPDLGSRARKLLERLSLAHNAFEELRHGGYDRLVVFKTYDVGPALWAARGGAAKVGYLSGGTEYYPGYAWLGRRLDYLASVSQHNAQQMARATGLRPAVNYLGVDGDCFRPTAPDEALARLAGLTAGDEVIVTAVRLVALKGVQRAMQAVALLAGRRPRLKLLVAGEGPYLPDLQRQVDELGLVGRVCFVGYLPQERLAGFYALGRLAAFPSLGEEALGLSAGEALACGLPVVASDLGGLPEVVGEGGVLVKPRDVEGLARAFERLLDDVDLARAMARRGGERIGRLFTWRACAQRMIDGFATGVGSAARRGE